MIQSGHKISHVMLDKLLCYVQNYDQMWSLSFMESNINF